MKKVTEQTSLYTNLEKMKIHDIIKNMNYEDTKVALKVRKSIPEISKLASIIFEKLSAGGRLFYIGSGTSGRLGILDASECPPTFGVSKNLVVGLIAGGDDAIRESQESAEDDTQQAWCDLKNHNINNKDLVIGISASGTTPYVIGGLKECQKNNIYTGCITCNKNMEIKKVSDTAIECIVGPEMITGSTRMKAGTAQKMILNMLSTSVMIKLGHVIDNKMVDMKLSNNKLHKRGTAMIMSFCNVEQSKALELLNKHGNVRSVLNCFNNVK